MDYSKILLEQAVHKKASKTKIRFNEQESHVHTVDNNTSVEIAQRGVKSALTAKDGITLQACVVKLKNSRRYIKLQIIKTRQWRQMNQYSG